MAQKTKHQMIVTSLSKKLKVPESVINLVIRQFFLGIRKVMYKNGDINIFGLFKIKMKKSYRKKVINNPDINLRKRKLGKHLQSNKTSRRTKK